MQLHNGHGILQIDIDPGVLPHVYRDAAAALVPNTPLKDMELNIIPGHRVGRRAAIRFDDPGLGDDHADRLG